jgi:enamine deaminase RidA (YjgF/YER057c/UK114 family)
VRRGNFVAVSPVAAVGRDGRVLAPDALSQARLAFERLKDALVGVEATLDDVVRVRVHYVDPGIADDFARAFAEAFPGGGPVLATLRVVSLAAPEILLEIEADAVVAETPRGRPPERVWDEGGD